MDEICAGERPPGGRMPSVGEYSAEVAVNVNTLMRTYSWLTDRGVIFTKRGLGYFVADDAKERILNLRRQAFFNGEAEYFFSRLAAFGFSPEQLAEAYRQYLEQF